MVLLSLLAVGLLSLSTIALRGSSQQSAMAEARSNARFALTIAIGELQKQFGPDQRISAPASIMGDPEGEENDVANAHWIGAWDSWVGENHYIAAINSESDLVPDLSRNRRDSFRQWLVSANDDQSLESIDFAKSSVPGESILLVGKGTLGNGSGSDLEVRAPRVTINDESGDPAGSFAWWVGDENQKAVIRAGRDKSDLALPAEVVAESDSPSSIAEELFPEFSAPVEESNLQRASMSVATLELLDEVTRIGGAYHDLTVDARSVLADVREGGLKRDLNTLGEYYDANFEGSNRTPGLPDDPEFTLYDFGRINRVPLHDLLTYYSLYKAQPKASPGTLLTSGKPHTANLSANELLANKTSATTNVYRQPVLLKTQLAIWARSERSGTNPQRPYRLKIRFTPIITFWNPYSVPLEMNGNGGPGTKVEIMGISADFAVWPDYSRGDAGRESSSLGGLTTGGGDNAQHNEVLASMVITDKVTFAPGEVRIFSLPQRFPDLATTRELKPGYNPISGNEVDYFDLRESRGEPTGISYDSDQVTFQPNQTIGIGFSGGTEDLKATVLKKSQGVSVEVRPNYPAGKTDWRTQALYSRRSVDEQPGDDVAEEMNGFNQMVFEIGNMLTGERLPWRTGKGEYTRNPYRIANLDSAQGEMVGVFTYGVAGEQEVVSNVLFGQSRFPSRPFLHSLPTAASPWIQDLSTGALYNLGWAWRIDGSSNSSTAIPSDGYRTFYGGGWEALEGQTRVVQFEFPQRPFHSLAQFSHAALGGWSVARNQPGDSTNGLNYFETTAANGQGGLFPQVSMAIGNSYAHPLIPRDKAITTWTMRKYHDCQRSEPFVDHSYLANFALWDEYFMSSVADQVEGLHATGSFGGRRVSQMLEEFFGDKAEPLPNRRMIPETDLSWSSLRRELLRGTRTSKDTCDRIARYLLLEGGFNVNSTSVDAWASLLGSLKGKPSLIMPGESNALTFDLENHDDDSLIPSFSIATGESTKANSSDRGDGSNPEQWVGSFTLSDREIRSLAEEIVKQVKKRGPFLSLSDFINRQLTSDTDLALSGALQTAIDEAGLNKQVDSGRSARIGRRSMFLREKRMVDPDPIVFPQAASGPVIQGSAAYIDQADVLRAIDSQLVPRGDTFVVRTCGESTDASGNVIARAYCEAIVQRTPEYIDTEDDPETRVSELQAPANQKFGRRFRISSFRWLSSDEV